MSNKDKKTKHFLKERNKFFWKDENILFHFLGNKTKIRYIFRDEKFINLFCYFSFFFL